MAAENYNLGPAHLIYGDFTDNGGSPNDVEYLGRTRGDVTIAPNVQIARGLTDQTGQAPLSNAIWFGGYAPVVTLPLVDEDKSRLSRIMPGSSVVTSGSKETITFNSVPKKIANADIGTLAIVPEKDSYATSEEFEDPEVWWLTAAISTELGEFVFGEITDEDDALNPHEVQMVGLYRDTLQDGNTSVPEDYRVMWRGTPDPDGNGVTGIAFPDLATIID